MKLTTRGRYAVTAMLDLTLHQNAGPVTLADVARRNRISPAYLEQLFASLRRQGLVESLRGPGGGYRLARPADEISVACVIAAVNEDVDATRCGGARDCHDGGRCLTHDLWEELTRHVRDFLESVTLAELGARHARRAAATGTQPLRRMPAPALASAK
ncbi:MAG TPA: Rrf2 family transcriptional regulator [Nevskiales bacterium]|nr:Rrf2 family transcriptional regulator [Nevskiales bacterium]